MSQQLFNVVILYYIVINIIAVIMYIIDKIKAVKHRWRISEATLIGIAYLGGSFGALTGMYVVRHKVRKLKFVILVPLAVIIHLALLIFICYRFTNP